MVLRKGELCCLAAAALILIFGRHSQPQAAVSAADEAAAGVGSNVKFTDLFKSDQLSAFLSQFQQQTNAIGEKLQNKIQQQQQSKNQNHGNERHRNHNRRMMLYDLAVLSHY